MPRVVHHWWKKWNQISNPKSQNCYAEKEVGCRKWMRISVIIALVLFKRANKIQKSTIICNVGPSKN